MEGWLWGDWHLTGLPQAANPFRQSGEKETTLYLVYDKKRDRYYFAELDGEGNPVDRERILNIAWESEEDCKSERVWLRRDYDALVEEQSRLRGWRKIETTLRFGELRVPQRKAYLYSHLFGMMEDKE